MGWFGYETLKRMTVNHPEHQFYFLFDRPFDQEFLFADNINPVVLSPPSRHPVLWFIWLEFSVHRFLKKNDIDLFVSPDGFVPLRTSTPVLPVVHDINFLHRPGDLPILSRKYYNYFFPKFVRKAKRVGTVSKYSAEDISRNYNIPSNRIDVFYNGVNAVYKPLEKEKIQEIRNNISKGKPYFIFIGTLHPRKNVTNLLRAYELFRLKSGKTVKMVIVGEKLFLTSEIEKVLKGMKYREDVIFTGRLNPGNLAEVLASALALSFVPFFEGFGIPVVEAMKCGVPVLASNVTSLPEVGGEAVLYSAPEDIDRIAVNMKIIAEEEKTREEYIRKGLERVKLFSWDKTATRFWKSIEKVLDET